MLVDARAQRALELVLGPIADAGLLIGGDVRPVEGAECGFQRRSARERRAARFLVGMAGAAIGGDGEVSAARDRGIIRGERWLAHAA